MKLVVIEKDEMKLVDIVNISDTRIYAGIDGNKSLCILQKRSYDSSVFVMSIFGEPRDINIRNTYSPIDADSMEKTLRHFASIGNNVVYEFESFGELIHWYIKQR